MDSMTDTQPSLTTPKLCRLCQTIDFDQIHQEAPDGSGKKVSCITQATKTSASQRTRDVFSVLQFEGIKDILMSHLNLMIHLAMKISALESLIRYIATQII